MHTHSANVMYSLSTNQLVFSFPDGTSREVTVKEGDVVWSDGVTHEVKNISDTVDRGIVVELKN